MKRLELAPGIELTSFQRGDDVASGPVAFDAGADGRLYVVYASNPQAYRAVHGGGASSAVARPRKPQSYRVLALNELGVELDVSIASEPFNIHHVQPLGELLLLACARCRYSSSGNHDRNGRVYTREGKLVDELVLGDGIQDLQTTRSGLIWTSYFDEGVFGNFGWSTPLGSAGLVAWDGTGRKVHEFRATSGLEPICDCYALNVVSNEEVWLSYYTDFPLVQLKSGRVFKHWPAPTRGSSAFAIGNGHCLFRGGYDERGSYILGRLGSSENLTVIQRFALFDEAGAPLEPTRTSARGDKIYLLCGTQVYALDLAKAFGVV
ncbi:MAG TPA: hypothetical protein VFQ61_04755 [Polyangiaceae bacterium]|nr:hypothetical protein [Polyangiaceae bacterium]